MVDHELNELRREFLQEADEKAREIAQTLADDRSSETLDRLAYLAHQLKGSGGSYGYQRISTDAAELEKAFEALARGESSDEARIRAHVDGLQSEIAQRMAEL
jgi:HPt (histidine-containing phosphotransfer) domain-containing protein